MKLEKKVAPGIMLLLISMGILSLMSDLTIANASPDTVLYVEPPSIVDPTLTPGTSFTVDVMISDVEYLYAWQVNMSFNPDVLRIFDIVEGDFLKVQPEGTFGAEKIVNEEGWALFGWTTIGEYLGASGSGTLATVEFEVVAEGESLIIIETNPIWVDPPGHWIYVTYLLGQNHPYPPPNFYNIPFTAEDGYFNNFGVAPPNICELIEIIESWNLPKGTEKSLIAKLKVAEHMLDMEREDGAIRKLTAFINRVETLRNKTLTNEQADYLKTEAQRIIDVIKE